ncbi:hypothetical protein ACQPZ8_32855 [Actinomadura nitritigenes]|uniref:hypothetical protein n=1 Tax=Actinomadura nitritigenes TaxID=134602 RepID=UPI003D94226D
MVTVLLPLITPADEDWRERDDGRELQAVAMNANVRCSHESALLLDPPVIEAVG